MRDNNNHEDNEDEDDEDDKDAGREGKAKDWGLTMMHSRKG